MLTRLFAVGLLAGSTLLCAASLYFIATSPYASRWLTVPLVAVFAALGVLRWRWQLVLFVFLAPLVYWVPAAEDGWRLQLVRMLFPFVLLPWSLRLLSPSAMPLAGGALRLPLLAYCGVILLSAVVSVWRYFPLLRRDTAVMLWNELVEANHQVWRAVYRPEFCIANETVVYLALPLFALLLLHSADRELLGRLRNALVAAAAAASVVAIVEKFSGAESAMLAVIGRENLQRVSGTLGDPNTFGAFLAMVAAPAVAQAVLKWPAAAHPLQSAAATWVHRAAPWCGVTLISLALLWTTSRAAWLGAAAAGVFLVSSIVSTRDLRLRWKPGARWGAAMLGLLAIALFAFGAVYARPHAQWNSAADVFWSLFSVDRLQRELTVRWMWWYSAFQMGAALPLTGVGIGAYRYYVNQYWPGIEPAGILSEPHNHYLKVFSELGLPGLALFAWIVWLVWRSGSGPGSASNAGLFERNAARAGLLALAVNMVFQHTLLTLEMQVITAVVVALAVAPGRAEARSGIRPASSPWTSAALAAAAGAIAWAGTYRAGDTWFIPAERAAKIGVVTSAGKAACLGRGGGLDVDLDLQLGRIFVLVPAGGAPSGGRFPKLSLMLNGYMVATWPLGPAERTFSAAAYARDGANRFQLRYLSAGDPDVPGGCSATIDSVTVTQGHLATYSMALDAPDAAVAMLRTLPARVAGEN